MFCVFRNSKVNRRIELFDYRGTVIVPFDQRLASAQMPSVFAIIAKKKNNMPKVVL